MACPDVERLLDAFVDSELPPGQLLEVAQHAASCPACEVAIGELTALRQSVAALVEQEANLLDLSGVWPAVEGTIGRRPGVPARVLALPMRRAVPALPAWGALVALAATLFLWLGAPSTREATPVASTQRSEPAVRIAAAPKPGWAVRSANHADIDRLSGKDIAVRREPKSGTTIIWVSHQVPEPR
jgi:anti-sigma factor RsiW